MSSAVFPTTAAAAAAAAAAVPNCSPCPPVPTFTFTHGFLVGQLSIVVLGLVLIRFLVFEDTRAQTLQRRAPFLNHAGSIAANARKQQRRAALGVASSTGRSGSAAAAAGAYAALWTAILERTGYDVSTHPPESTDWINVLFAQAIAGYREDAMAGGASMISRLASGRRGLNASNNATPGLGKELGAQTSEDEAAGKRDRNAKDLVQEALNFRISKANIDWLDPIHVIDVDFGEQFPTFSSARVRPADDTGRMRIEVDIDYNDQISLSIETKLVVNFPKPRFAVLPISLSLTVVRFSGTLALELFSTVPSTVLPTEVNQQPHPANASNSASKTGKDKSAPLPKPKCRHHLHISLHPDFVLEAHASSLIGSRAKLQDIPKIEQLLVARLRAFVLDRFVWPRFWAFGLPNLVPGPSFAAPAPRTKAEGGISGSGASTAFAAMPAFGAGLGASLGAATTALPGSFYGPGLRRPGLHSKFSATGSGAVNNAGIPEMTVGRGTERVVYK
ncbi:ERMES complex subunit mmm1 [Tilletia horrida]|nr:ERMES complex subunit mmm1 [Tilletia horrida]KAK0570231.1 ERMES complex subunit mmm1 [Tilletia horrida]